MKEDEVHIGNVVQLSASELAQPQNHQLGSFSHPPPAPCFLFGEPPVGVTGEHIKPDLEGNGGQITDLPGGFRQVRPPQKVAASDAQKMALFEVAKGGEEIGEGLSLSGDFLQILIELGQRVAAVEVFLGKEPIRIVLPTAEKGRQILGAFLNPFDFVHALSLPKPEEDQQIVRSLFGCKSP